MVQLGWRGDKVMQAERGSLEIPGVRRRILRFRSWWNKSELYPPSVDQYWKQRNAFFARERAHAALWPGSVRHEVEGVATRAVEGRVGEAARHLQRGAALLFCQPLSVFSVWRHDGPT